MEKQYNYRLCLSLPQNLIKKVDEYALNMNVTRTSAICILINKGLVSENK